MMRTGIQRMQENTAFLKSVPLLKNLNNDVLTKIADVLEVVSVCFILIIFFIRDTYLYDAILDIHSKEQKLFKSDVVCFFFVCN